MCAFLCTTVREATPCTPGPSTLLPQLFCPAAAVSTVQGSCLTLGQGNQLVCEAIELLGRSLVGQEIEELMADFGTISRRLAQHPQLRWLGPQKGVVHLALASLTNACFDLWAKARGVPLWRLLLDLSPRECVSLLDLSYLEDVLTQNEAMTILQEQLPTRAES